MPCAPGPARSGLELTRQSSGCAGLDHDGRRHQHLRPLLVRAHSGAGPCSSSMTAPPVVDPVVRHLGRALLPRVDEFAQQAFRVGGREPKATVTGASMGVRPGSSGAPLQPATGTGHPRGQHRSRKGAHSWCSPAYVGRVGVREQYGNLEHTAVVRARSMAPIGRPAGWAVNARGIALDVAHNAGREVRIPRTMPNPRVGGALAGDQLRHPSEVRRGTQDQPCLDHRRP